MERVIRKLSSYVNSHIYDIHAILVSFVVLLVMYFLSKKVRNVLEKWVDTLCCKKPELKNRKSEFLRKSNLILVVMEFLLSIVFFALASFISPFIRFSLPSAVMSSVFVLFEYALIRQLFVR